MSQKQQMNKFSKGLMLAAIGAGVSILLGKAFPLLGSSLFAILCGIVLNASRDYLKVAGRLVLFGKESLTVFHYFDGIYSVLSKSYTVRFVFLTDQFTNH